MTTKFEITCGNPNCNAFKKIFNSFEVDFKDESYEEAFLEGYGHGGQDDADYCPHCEVLGVLDFAEPESAK